MGSFSERVTRQIWQRIPAIDLQANTSNTVFLAGTGRSGTTWLSNRINQRNDFRYMFEPFHPDYVAAAKPFGSRPYLSRDISAPGLVASAKRILSGKVQGQWVNRYNRKLFVKKRLVKDIRTNLMLGWMKEQFPEMPMVLLLRHPLAVAASKRKLGWHGTVDIFLQQKDLTQTHLAEFEHAIREAGKDLYSIEALVWMWAIENLVALRELRQGEALVLFYEDFVRSPEESLRQLFDYLNMPFDQELTKGHGKPSPTTRADSAVRKNPEDMLSSWRKHILPGEIEKTQQILNLTGLNQLYSEHPLPQGSPENLLSLF
ncbi:MAG: sulfotransferase [Bacteroidia bacterium]